MTLVSLVRKFRLMVLFILCTMLSACVGTVVGAVADTAVEVIKVPFKVGGAIIDAVTPDGDDFTDELSDAQGQQLSGSDSTGTLPMQDESALKMESEGLR